MQHPESLIGATLDGKYRLDALLGVGGFGAVYRGWHLRLELPVAVKIAFRVEGAFGERFRREARVLMRLHHPHIVRVYDYDRTADGLVYLVQEFVAGRTLNAVILERGPLPPSDVVELGRQVLSALAAAHSVGIIHRDIKPDNLMLTGSIEAPCLRLLDFGIAKLHQIGSGEAELTQTGKLIGTPAYMAPEQIRGQPVPASDLYAVGIMLFFLLTGQRPYPYPIPQVLISHLQDPIPQLPSEVPPNLARVVHRAMAKTPFDRYVSADEMRTALLGAVTATESQRAAQCIPGVAIGARATLDEGITSIDGTEVHSEFRTYEEVNGMLDDAGLAPRRPARRSALVVTVALLGLVGGAWWINARWSSSVDNSTQSQLPSTTKQRPASSTTKDNAPRHLVPTQADARIEVPSNDAAASAYDATSIPPDAATSPPEAVPQPEIKSGRSRRRRIRRAPPPRPQPSAAQQAARKAQRALDGCRCHDADVLIKALSSFEREEATRMRDLYRKRCLVPGLPGACR